MTMNRVILGLRLRVCIHQSYRKENAKNLMDELSSMKGIISKKRINMKTNKIQKLLENFINALSAKKMENQFLFHQDLHMVFRL